MRTQKQELLDHYAAQEPKEFANLMDSITQRAYWVIVVKGKRVPTICSVVEPTS